jgi:hypothetical protein
VFETSRYILVHAPLVKSHQHLAVDDIFELMLVHASQAASANPDFAM